jgi:small subunit ribosomal protein S1
MTDERDFAAILEEFEQGHPVAEGGREPKPGDKVTGRVLSIGEEAVFVDVGAKSDGVVPRGEVTDEEGGVTVAVGDSLEALVAGRDAESGCLLLRVRPGGAGSLASAAGGEAALAEIAAAHEHRLPVEGTVREAVKGGVEVTVAGLRAFCPVSQLDLAYVEDAAAWVGRRLTFVVTRFEESGRGGRPNVVLSRRELLQEEERRRRAEALARLAKGAVLRGTVTTVTGYGAFVDLGGVEGLLHVSEMDHRRVADPADVVAVGEELEVEVLAIEEREGQDPRISLSRRSLLRDPWEGVAERYPPGRVVAGRVMRLEPYGAFVEVAPGLEGLVHVSELGADRRVLHPREVVELGQDVRVRVLEVAPERRRLALSLASPAEEEGAPGEGEGGRDEPSGFGSMADFFGRSRKP